MAFILNIETSTKSTSVAIAKNGKLIAIKEEHEVVSHATKLTPFIIDVLKEAKLTLQDLSAIAVSIGPGSYTGLRIGLSTAKGLCYSLKIPLISISALKAMACELINIHKKYKLFVSVMNSRKNELYLCSIDSLLNITTEPIAITVDESFLKKHSESIIIGGTGLEKLKNIKLENISFDNNIKFSTFNMLKPTYELYKKEVFSDLAYIEPNYLKPFISK
jgi:tRNA threonylcarbamoyladenosine biosynthesis protein TsaB